MERRERSLGGRVQDLGTGYPAVASGSETRLREGDGCRRAHSESLIESRRIPMTCAWRAAERAGRRMEGGALLMSLCAGLVDLFLFGSRNSRAAFLSHGVLYEFRCNQGCYSCNTCKEPPISTSTALANRFLALKSRLGAAPCFLRPSFTWPPRPMASR